MKAVTLADVARAAGTHKATAARALNRDPRITMETRERVERAAQKLGYKVNHLLAAWMSTRRRQLPVGTAVIGYITGHPTRHGWRPPASDLPDFFPGARERAQRAGYQLEEFWTREKGMTPERFTGILRARNIQGVLIGRMPGPDTTLLEYDWSPFAVVALGLSLAAPLFNRVRENHFQTAQTAAAQCHARGYRRIGLAFDRADDVGRMNDMWVGGFASEAAKWGRDAYRVPPLINPQRDRRTFETWFRRHRPDAVIVSQAKPVRDWLAELGREVPRDVGLVELRCYDPAAGNAGVYYDPARTGALALEMLIGNLHRQERGVPPIAHEVLLQGVWNEGTTLPVVAGKR
jgi:LacI family transcriptional regulator